MSASIFKTGWIQGRTIVWMLAFFAAGYLLRGFLVPARPSSAGAAVAEGLPGKAETWTCSMHPQIRQPKPGACPICGMDLIPVEMDSSAGSDAPRQITLSPAARRLAEVALAPVERRSVAIDVRLVGKVQFDETRLATISPRVAGRIDKLHVNFVGMSVKAGDPLADLYSPELVSAQKELLLAGKSSGKSEPFAAWLDSARERLRRWGLTEGQIAGIERGGEVRDHVTFRAPMGGIVVEKGAREGQYVEEGMSLFTVADLSRVWVQLDAYESDLAWLRVGQEVGFQAEAFPGEAFTGTVAFIDPAIDPTTRTAKVRVEAANGEGRLKPEMFVRAVVRAAVAEEGGEAPLTIPATAPLVTGKRAVVYVAVPQKEGTYEGREIVLGVRAGDFYVVREGLEESERVVVNGAFKIDSSLQIQGKPSMMGGTRPEEGAAGGEGQGGMRLQTLCPIMKLPIDRELYRDFEGWRIYVCCPGCLDEVRRRAAEIVREHRERGIEFERVPEVKAHGH